MSLHRAWIDDRRPDFPAHRRRSYARTTALDDRRFTDTHLGPGWS
ncbi:hypothetical protein [Actinoplanes sp. NPDC026670]